MPLKTLLITGPLQSGKSTVARLIADRVIEPRPHLLRLRAARDGHTNAVIPLRLCGRGVDENGWASLHRVTYTADRVFETVPEALRTVRQLQRKGFVILETDGDPAIRHAYPYDYRVFVMPAPKSVHEVFREPEAAAVALHQVMQDTAAFASEIFGLFDGDAFDDSADVSHGESPGPEAGTPGSRCVEHLDIGESQIRQFLRSPIGAEIASRIQLQPQYHPLVEADIVVINTGLGGCFEALDGCVRRIEKLLSRIRHDARRHSVLYWGNIIDERDPAHDKFVQRLKTLLLG